MSKIYCALFITLAGMASLLAQTPVQSPAPPQTARQALIEMFLGKSADAFERHLPEVARLTLIHKGETPETSMVQKIASIGRQVTMQGEHVETFDTGPTLLVTEEKSGAERTEVMLEHDSLMGEVDEIEVSIHVYRNGEPEFLPVIPSLTFSLKQEKEIWRLTEVTLSVHAPLTDPDYLKGLRKEQDESNEAMASGRVGTIASLEATYASRHPDQGYTCKLADLFKPEPSPDNSQESSPVYDASSANGEFAGYAIALTGCSGSPASKFQIIATPTDSDAGLKTFCTDQSGTIRFTVGGKNSSCLTRGQVLNPERTQSYGTIIE